MKRNGDDHSQRRRKVLVVEDDALIAGAIASVIRASLDPLVVSSVAAARESIGGVDLDGAIVDLMLPDGSGLDLVAEIREQHPVLPVLILTGHAEPELINRAHALRAEYVCKPEYHQNLKEFLRRVVQGPEDDQGRLREAARDLASRFSLSVRETEILNLAITGVPRAHIAEVLGVSENTIKTQVRSILDKTNQTSLSEVVWMVRQPPEG